MNDLVRALAIAAVILAPVVAFIIVISMAVVKRGEAEQAERPHEIPEAPVEAKAAAAPAPKAAKAAVPAADEISVPVILIFAVVLFTLAVVGLFALSLIQHMM